VEDKSSPEDEILTDEEDAVASDLDMHKLILNGLQGGSCEDNEPVKTAEEVLQEIDDIIQVIYPTTAFTFYCSANTVAKMAPLCSPSLYFGPAEILILLKGYPRDINVRLVWSHVYFYLP